MAGQLKEVIYFKNFANKEMSLYRYDDVGITPGPYHAGAWYCLGSYTSGGFFDTRTRISLYTRVPNLVPTQDWFKLQTGLLFNIEG